MSLIMRARTEEGDALTDRELRDELMTLVLAGHETTANQLAWAWERLVRSAGGARAAARGGPRGATTTPTTWSRRRSTRRCASRPVIPMTGRRVTVPWRSASTAIPADTAVAISILLLHHREDVYPDPFAFRPERWLGRKPGTYEWIPFGGGTRRCLGAALAMAEQRVVLRDDGAAARHRGDRPRSPSAPSTAT